ncbi:Integrin-linked protein kinase [Exaiptasia diaphana]|nr:Integrin-linked protein kinase [Exaiptasia diaphana]
MEDIFSASRDGNTRFVKTWLEDTRNDLNLGDDHGFTPFLWACREGQVAIFDMLLSRGARVNAVNDGGDNGLHLAASKGNKEVVLKLLRNKCAVNGINEHGNTPLHYACFWNYESVAEELVKKGAYVSQCNRFGETPLDKSKPYLAEILKDLATQLGQNLKKIPYKDTVNPIIFCLDLRDIKDRYEWISPDEITLTEKISKTVTGEVWRGKWNDINIVAKKLAIKFVNKRISRNFSEEYSKLRIFSHPNVLPVIGAVNDHKNLIVLSQQMHYGSLFNILHEGTGIIVDQEQAIKFAMDIARGMAYLHSLDQLIPRLYLKSTHVMIDEDLTARISMADYRFSFMNLSKYESPNWMAPEFLQKSPEEVDQRSADMWSYAILLWELVTREVPFADLSPMEIGMKVALEGLKPPIPPGVSSHMVKLVSICWNPDPSKRPRFDQIIPILTKMSL